MDHVRFKLSGYFKIIRNLWSVIAPGILFHVPVDESSFEMSQKVLITISHCLTFTSSYSGKSVGRVLPWRHIEHSPRELLQHHRHVHRCLCHLPNGVFCWVCAQDSACFPVHLFPPGGAFSSPQHFDKNFMICLLFRVNMVWTQMLDCPSLVSTMETSSTSCKSFVIIIIVQNQPALPHVNLSS